MSKSSCSTLFLSSVKGLRQSCVEEVTKYIRLILVKKWTVRAGKLLLVELLLLFMQLNKHSLLKASNRAMLNCRCWVQYATVPWHFECYLWTNTGFGKAVLWSHWLKVLKCLETARLFLLYPVAVKLRVAAHLQVDPQHLWIWMLVCVFNEGHFFFWIYLRSFMTVLQMYACMVPTLAKTSVKDCCIT